MEPFEVISRNVARIRERIAAAASAAGRSADEVRLIAVTKYVAADVARLVIQAGCRELGESRPQALWQKHDQLADLSPNWHLIGHLQTNKVRRTLGLPQLFCIQSVDRLHLLDNLEKEASRFGREINVLLEVRVSADATKHGWTREELPLGVERALSSQHLNLRGLMAMSTLHATEDMIRREFETVRRWRDEIAAEFHAAEQLRELSLGMSRDFKIGIACGATMVRIGSALFEGMGD